MFLLLTPSLIPLWLENILCVLWILLNVFTDLLYDVGLSVLGIVPCTITGWNVL